jgi:hypothetical protein
VAYKEFSLSYLCTGYAAQEKKDSC